VKPRLVYFALDDKEELVKIGSSVDPQARTRQFRAEGRPSRIVSSRRGGFEDERWFHRRFAEYRVSGEWFEYRGALKAYVQAHSPMLLDRSKRMPEEITAALKKEPCASWKNVVQDVAAKGAVSPMP
jgi:hypothetical protein